MGKAGADAQGLSLRSHPGLFLPSGYWILCGWAVSRAGRRLGVCPRLTRTGLFSQNSAYSIIFIFIQRASRESGTEGVIKGWGQNPHLSWALDDCENRAYHYVLSVSCGHI